MKQRATLVAMKIAHVFFRMAVLIVTVRCYHVSRRRRSTHDSRYQQTCNSQWWDSSWANDQIEKKWKTIGENTAQYVHIGQSQALAITLELM